MIAECLHCKLPVVMLEKTQYYHDKAQEQDEPGLRGIDLERIYGVGWLCLCETPRIRLKVDTSTWRGIYGGPA